jgi:putative DNA primase/helicase
LSIEEHVPLGHVSMAARPAMELSPLPAALHYAGRGWFVFPLHSVGAGGCTCGQDSCSRPGKHPRTGHGLHDATTDPEQIREWWGSWPDANIGLRTGQVSGLVVLDIDPRSGGEQSLEALEADYERLSVTVAAVTGGGGRHLFFRQPSHEVRNSAGKLGAGLDVRGEGGYVVAPPSRHASGAQYEWLPGLSPEEATLADPPEWLLALLSGAGENRRRREAPTLVGDLIAEGSRNATLASLAGGMRRRGMDEQGIRAELLKLNEAKAVPPLPQHEVTAIAKSVSRYEPAPASRRYKRSDYGNAEGLVDRHGSDLRYSRGLGWVVWDGRRWRRDGDGEAMRRMKETVRAMWKELAGLEDRDERDAVYRFLLRSETASRLKAALELAESESAVVVSAAALDADPWLLNVENGTVDLRTGELREHRRDDLITRLSPVAYVPEARSPLWEEFLARVSGGDEELQAFLQRAVGYSLSGLTSEEKLFFAHGPGASGKSTFLEAIKAVIGEYAATADFESFLKKKGDGGVRNDIARLAGVRLTIGVEVEQGKQLAEGLVKSLTGGDTITARHLYKEHFEFLPRFTLWLAANDRPRVSGSDSGIWRRIVQLPFTVVIPEQERDPTLKQRLKSDPEIQSSILAWAIEGCRAWQEQGLNIPERVKLYTEEYREENDPFADFFEERCLFEPTARVRRSELRQAYEQWARTNGEWVQTAKALASALKARNVRDGGKIDGERAWAGVALAARAPTTGGDDGSILTNPPS